MTPQPWNLSNHCLVADCTWDGKEPDLADLAYYGGVPVCESISIDDGTFVLIAIRQRDILWRMLLCMMVGGVPEHTENYLRAAREACLKAERDAGFEGIARQAIMKIIRPIYEDVRYGFPLLPETATRARIEPIGFVYWHSGKFVTDNVELDWVLMGDGRCETMPFYDFDKGSGKWIKDEDGSLCRRTDAVNSMYRDHVMPHNDGPRPIPGMRAAAFIQSCMEESGTVDDDDIPF